MSTRENIRLIARAPFIFLCMSMKVYLYNYALWMMPSMIIYEGEGLKKSYTHMVSVHKYSLPLW